MAHINRERLVGVQADRCGAHWQGFSITKAANVLTGAGWMAGGCISCAIQFMRGHVPSHPLHCGHSSSSSGI